MVPHVLQRRRDAAAAAWQLRDEIVLVAAGDSIPVPGSGDQTYPFLPHPEHRYLADSEVPGAVLAFDPAEGWTEFVPQLTAAERVWTGGRKRPGLPRSRLEAWRKGRGGKRVAGLGCALPGLPVDPDLTQRTRAALNVLRRRKDEAELERMRLAARATEAAFQAARRAVAPGATERDVAIDLEAALLRGGADRCAYATIVGSGPNSAVLHFAPSRRAMRPGELVLIDAGGEVGGYACDVTRTHGVGGLTPFQGELYAAVLRAQTKAIARCRAGTSYVAIHEAACLDLTEGLMELGLLSGDPASLVQRGAHALFFPHGIGHAVGIGVRDGGAYPAPAAPPENTGRPSVPAPRIDVVLEPGMTVTIEPGLYFIPAILEDPERRARFAGVADWDRIDRLSGSGGIRIEDCVHVTAGEPEVLTAAIPK